MSVEAALSSAAVSRSAAAPSVSIVARGRSGAVRESRAKRRRCGRAGGTARYHSRRATISRRRDLPRWQATAATPRARNGARVGAQEAIAGERREEATVPIVPNDYAFAVGGKGRRVTTPRRPKASAPPRAGRRTRRASPISTHVPHERPTGPLPRRDDCCAAHVHALVPLPAPSHSASRSCRACRSLVRRRCSKDDAVDWNRLALSLELHWRAERPASGGEIKRVAHLLSDEDLTSLGEPEQRRYAVFTVSPMTVNSSRRSDPMLPAEFLTVVDGDAHAGACGRPSVCHFRIQLFEGAHHVEGGRLQRTIGVVATRRSARPTRHQAVADELVQRAALSNTISTIASKYSLSIAHRLGGNASEIVVKPRMSLKSTATESLVPPRNRAAPIPFELGDPLRDLRREISREISAHRAASLLNTLRVLADSRCLRRGNAGERDGETPGHAR